MLRAGKTQTFYPAGQYQLPNLTPLITPPQIHLGNYHGDDHVSFPEVQMQGVGVEKLNNSSDPWVRQYVLTQSLAGREIQDDLNVLAKPELRQNQTILHKSNLLSAPLNTNPSLLNYFAVKRKRRPPPFSMTNPVAAKVTPFSKKSVLKTTAAAKTTPATDEVKATTTNTPIIHNITNHNDNKQIVHDNKTINHDNKVINYITNDNSQKLVDQRSQYDNRTSVGRQNVTHDNSQVINNVDNSQTTRIDKSHVNNRQYHTALHAPIVDANVPITIKTKPVQTAQPGFLDAVPDLVSDFYSVPVEEAENFKNKVASERAQHSNLLHQKALDVAQVTKNEEIPNSIIPTQLSETTTTTPNIENDFKLAEEIQQQQDDEFDKENLQLPNELLFLSHDTASQNEWNSQIQAMPDNEWKYFLEWLGSDFGLSILDSEHIAINLSSGDLYISQVPIPEHNIYNFIRDMLEPTRMEIKKLFEYDGSLSNFHYYLDTIVTHDVDNMYDLGSYSHLKYLLSRYNSQALTLKYPQLMLKHTTMLNEQHTIDLLQMNGGWTESLCNAIGRLHGDDAHQTYSPFDKLTTNLSQVIVHYTECFTKGFIEAFYNLVQRANLQTLEDLLLGFKDSLPNSMFEPLEPLDLKNLSKDVLSESMIECWYNSGKIPPDRQFIMQISANVLDPMIFPFINERVSETERQILHQGAQNAYDEYLNNIRLSNLQISDHSRLSFEHSIKYCYYLEELLNNYDRFDDVKKKEKQEKNSNEDPRMETVDEAILNLGKIASLQEEYDNLNRNQQRDQDDLDDIFDLENSTFDPNIPIFERKRNQAFKREQDKYVPNYKRDIDWDVKWKQEDGDDYNWDVTNTHYDPTPLQIDLLPQNYLDNLNNVNLNNYNDTDIKLESEYVTNEHDENGIPLSVTIDNGQLSIKNENNTPGEISSNTIQNIDTIISNDLRENKIKITNDLNDVSFTHDNPVPPIHPRDRMPRLGEMTYINVNDPIIESQYYDSDDDISYVAKGPSHPSQRLQLENTLLDTIGLETMPTGFKIEPMSEDEDVIYVAKGPSHPSQRLQLENTLLDTIGMETIPTDFKIKNKKRKNIPEDRIEIKPEIKKTKIPPSQTVQESLRKLTAKPVAKFKELVNKERTKNFFKTFSGFAGRTADFPIDVDNPLPPETDPLKKQLADKLLFNERKRFTQARIDERNKPFPLLWQ